MVLMTQIADILTAAADRAAREITVRKAVAAGWSACHVDRNLISEAFQQWAAAEDYAGDIPAFGDVLRRRYKNAGPAAIGDSLRRAAAR